MWGRVTHRHTLLAGSAESAAGRGWEVRPGTILEGRRGQVELRSLPSDVCGRGGTMRLVGGLLVFHITCLSRSRQVKKVMVGWQVRKAGVECIMEVIRMRQFSHVVGT